MKRVIPSLALIGSLVAASPLLAAGLADSIQVVDPYVRQAPPGAMATGAFMVLKNTGSKDVRLVKADNPLSKVTELHTHLNEGGVMKMRPVKDITIPAGGEAVLKPGSLHVMLIDLKSPMNEGDKVAITLAFEDGSSKVVDMPVSKAAQPMTPMSPMPVMKHDMKH